MNELLRSIVEDSFIIPTIIFILLIIFISFSKSRNKTEKVLLEDMLHTSLNKPLTIKKYKKYFKNRFMPYKLNLATKLNKNIFNTAWPKIEKATNKKDELSYLKFVFLNKINGFEIAKNIDDKEYINVLLDNSFEVYEPYEEYNKIYYNILTSVLESDYDEIHEINMDGIIEVNKKKYLLDDLTSIGIFSANNYIDFKNRLKDTDFILHFSFNTTSEIIICKSIDKAINYLFNNNKSDIRLIQKIYNSSAVFFGTKEDEYDRVV